MGGCISRRRRRRRRLLNALALITIVLLLLRAKRLKQEIEVRVGRQPSERFGPRAIDLDIILYGRKAIGLSDLQVRGKGMGAQMPLFSLSLSLSLSLSSFRPSFPPSLVGTSIDCSIGCFRLGRSLTLACTNVRLSSFPSATFARAKPLLTLASRSSPFSLQSSAILKSTALERTPIRNADWACLR